MQLLYLPDLKLYAEHWCAEMAKYIERHKWYRTKIMMEWLNFQRYYSQILK